MIKPLTIKAYRLHNDNEKNYRYHYWTLKKIILELDFEDVLLKPPTPKEISVFLENCWNYCWVMDVEFYAEKMVFELVQRKTVKNQRNVKVKNLNYKVSYVFLTRIHIPVCWHFKTIISYILSELDWSLLIYPRKEKTAIEKGQ